MTTDTRNVKCPKCGQVWSIPFDAQPGPCSRCFPSRNKPTESQPDGQITPGNTAQPEIAAQPAATKSPFHGRVSSVAGKALSASYSTLALVGAVLFFMPWVRISCQDVTIMKQSGLEIAMGKVSDNPDFDKEFGKKVKQSGLGQGLGMGPAFQPTGGDKQSNKKQQDDFKKKVGAFPVVWVYYAGLLCVVIFGILGLSLIAFKRPLVPLIGAVASTLAICVTFIVKLPIEKAAGGGNTPEEKMLAEMMKGMFQQQRTWAYTSSVVISFLVLALAIAHFVVATRQLKRRTTGKTATAQSPRYAAG